MRLDELFDKAPEELGKDFGSDGEKFYQFKVDKDTYLVQFKAWPDDSGDPRDNNKWSMSYGYHRDKRQYEPDRSNGNALKVLGTVVHYIERFLKEENPTQLAFTGENEFGLADVYSKMISVLRKRTNALGYEFSQRALSDTMMSFIIYRKDVGKRPLYNDIPTKKVTEARLNELFNKDLGDTEVSAAKKTYEFRDDGITYRMIFEDHGDNCWEFAYGYLDKHGHIEYVPPRGKEGSGVKILSTIVAYVERFIQREKPRMITFDGSNSDDLDKLYTGMARVLNRRLAALGYQISSDHFGHVQGFLITPVDAEIPHTYKVIDKSKKVTEAFDSPVKTERSLSSTETEDYNFTVNNVDYFISFEFEDGLLGEKIYDLCYGFSGKGGLAKYTPTGETNKKDALKVLSTVVKVAGDFIEDFQPDILKFTGNKEMNLESLYRMMLRSMKSKLDRAGYKIETEDAGEDMVFYIVRN